MDLSDAKKNEATFLSLTSLTMAEFEYLLDHFAPRWERYARYHTLEGRKRVIVRGQEHKSAALQGTDQKLFFLLVYLKNNSLQTFQGASFGISQSKVSKIYRVLLQVLDETLSGLGLSPCRDSAALQTTLANHCSQTFWYDGTETPILRNSAPDGQEAEYSGKKKATGSKI